MQGPKRLPKRKKPDLGAPEVRSFIEKDPDGRAPAPASPHASSHSEPPTLGAGRPRARKSANKATPQRKHAPAIDLQSPRVQYNVRVPVELLDQARHVAAHLNTSITGLFVRGLHDRVLEVISQYEKMTGRPFPEPLDVELEDLDGT